MKPYAWKIYLILQSLAVQSHCLSDIANAVGFMGFFVVMQCGNVEDCYLRKMILPCNDHCCVFIGNSSLFNNIWYLKF